MGLQMDYYWNNYFRIAFDISTRSLERQIKSKFLHLNTGSTSSMTWLCCNTCLDLCSFFLPRYQNLVYQLESLAQFQMLLGEFCIWFMMQSHHMCNLLSTCDMLHLDYDWLSCKLSRFHMLSDNLSHLKSFLHLWCSWLGGSSMHNPILLQSMLTKLWDSKLSSISLRTQVRQL